MNEMLLNFPRGEYAISVFVWDCIAIRKDGGGGRMTHRYALRPTGRRKRRCFAALNSNLIEGSRPSPWGICDFCVRMRLYCYKKGWWWGKDSNLRSLRRQIYSLLPLAAREPHQIFCRPVISGSGAHNNKSRRAVKHWEVKNISFAVFLLLTLFE